MVAKARVSFIKLDRITMENNKSLDKLVIDLKERAKELNCLYEIQELLNNPNKTIEDVCTGIVEAIPPGWQFPEVCHAKLTYRDSVYNTTAFSESPWSQCTEIKVQDEVVGNICVY